MADLVQDFLERLRLTQGDAQAQAVVSADFALAVRETAGETKLRDAFDAAAVLRWFDVPRLAGVLAVSEAEAAEQFHALAFLPFVEPYPATGARNVHEATRLGWRKRMTREQPHRFKELSARAAACLAENHAPAGRIEWIYHLLSTDPETASQELETLDRAWTGSAYPEHRQALALALAELETSSLLAGRARVEVLLCVAEASTSRDEMAGLRDIALTARTLAEEFNHASGLARAWALTGDIEWTEGKLPKARAAFGAYLRISQQLAEQDPGNAGGQRDLAVAHSKLGDVWWSEGNLPEAHSAFDECLRISRQLAAQDRSNAGGQRDLAVAHSKLGDIWQAEGNLPEAHSAFDECLRISRQLAAQDPGNAGWQRDLAVAHCRLGDIWQAEGKHPEARDAFGEYLRISHQLAAQDPGNADWQRNLAVAHSRLGERWLAERRLPEARAAFGQCLRISQQLAAQSPDNTVWQRELAVAQSKLGDIWMTEGKLPEARAAFGEYLRISQQLAAQDPGNAGWQRSLAVALAKLGNIESRRGFLSDAVDLLAKAEEIFARLVKLSPSNKDWQGDYKRSDYELAKARRELATWNQASRSNWRHGR